METAVTSGTHGASVVTHPFRIVESATGDFWGYGFPTLESAHSALAALRGSMNAPYGDAYEVVELTLR